MSNASRGVRPGGAGDALEDARLPERRRRWGGRVGWRCDRRDGLLHRRQVAVVGSSPDLDHDGRAGLRDAAGLTKRLDHVGCEEERIEPGDDVERVVCEGKGLHVADPHVCLGHARASERDERFRRIEADDVGPEIGREPQEDARAASRLRARAARLRGRCGGWRPRRSGPAAPRSGPSPGAGRPREAPSARRFRLLPSLAATVLTST